MFRFPLPFLGKFRQTWSMALRQIHFINVSPLHCNPMNRDKILKCRCICFPLVNLPHKCPDRQYLNRRFLTDMLTIRLTLKLIAMDCLSEHHLALAIHLMLWSALTPLNKKTAVFLGDLRYFVFLNRCLNHVLDNGPS